MEYNVVYRGMILSDRSIAVDIHVHDTTKQYQSFITSCMDVVRTWLIAREPSIVVAGLGSITLTNNSNSNSINNLKNNSNSNSFN